MTDTKIVIVGTPELVAQLNQLSDKARGEVTRNALVAGSLPFQNRWKQLVRDRAFKTGTYMRSIHTEVVKGQGGTMEAIVGTDIVEPPYPFFLEYGTSRMAPRATMRPAWDETEEQVVQEVIDVVNILLSQYGGK